MQQSGTILKRRILFRKSKPFIRKFELSDMWVLWAAYKEGSFPQIKEGMTKEEFYEFIKLKLSVYSVLFLVEDACKMFKEKRGPVCLIAAFTDGWKIEPHVEFFKWANKQNILRVNVRFFNWIRQNKEVGVCIVRSLKPHANLFHHVRQYGVLNFVGRIPGGDIRGDEWVFSIRGKKANGAIASAEGIQRNGEPSDPARSTTNTSE